MVDHDDVHHDVRYHGLVDSAMDDSTTMADPGSAHGRHGRVRGRSHDRSGMGSSMNGPMDASMVVGSFMDVSPWSTVCRSHGFVHGLAGPMNTSIYGGVHRQSHDRPHCNSTTQEPSYNAAMYLTPWARSWTKPTMADTYLVDHDGGRGRPRSTMGALMTVRGRPYGIDHGPVMDGSNY